MPTYIVEGWMLETLLIEARSNRSARKIVVDHIRRRLVPQMTTPLEAAIAAQGGAIIMVRETTPPWETNDAG